MLQLTIPKVQAWEHLNDPEYNRHLSMGELKELMLTTGYSEEEAQRVASQRGWERLTEGMTL